MTKADVKVLHTPCMYEERAHAPGLRWHVWEEDGSRRVVVNTGRFTCHFTVDELCQTFTRSFSSARKYRWSLDSIAQALS